MFVFFVDIIYDDIEGGVCPPPPNLYLCPQCQQANSTHAAPWWKLEPRSLRCEATAPTTVPSYHPRGDGPSGTLEQHVTRKLLDDS